MIIETTYNKNGLDSYLNAISPISTGQKEIATTVIIEFFFLFLSLVLLKPVFMSYLSITSVIQMALTTSFIYTTIGWAYYAWDANRIDVKYWTLEDDIMRFYKVSFFSSIIYGIYTSLALNYFYKNELNLNNWSFDNFTVITIFLFILFIGTLAFVLLKIIDYIRFTKYTASQYSDEKSKTLSIPEIINNEKILTLCGKNKDEKITLNLEDFLYLQSYGHYTKVYINNNLGEPQVKTLRNSINNVICNMNNYSDIYHCHRSYIININKLNKIQGNSKKAFLTITGSTYKIPLSRELYQEIKNKNNAYSVA